MIKLKMNSRALGNVLGAALYLATAIPAVAGTPHPAHARPVPAPQHPQMIGGNTCNPMYTCTNGRPPIILPPKVCSANGMPC